MSNLTPNAARKQPRPKWPAGEPIYTPDLLGLAERYELESQRFAILAQLARIDHALQAAGEPNDSGLVSGLCALWLRNTRAGIDNNLDRKVIELALGQGAE